jgi:hypothetical protein
MFWYNFWLIVEMIARWTALFSILTLILLFIFLKKYRNFISTILLIWMPSIAAIIGVIVPGFIAETKPTTNLLNPILYVEGSFIKWNSIENASKYTVKVNNGQEFDKTIGSEEINTDNGSLFNSGFNTVEITAVAMNRFFIDSSTSENFYKLPSITGLNYDPETQLLTWDPIEINLIPNIEYSLTINSTSEQFSENLSTNSFNMSEYEEGILSVTGRAFSDVDFVLDSKPTDYNFSHLFEVDFVNDTLSWEPLTGATGYRIYADNEYKEVGSNITNQSLKNWDLFTPGIKSLEVRPLSGTEEFRSEIFTVGKPGPISSLDYDLETKTISWSASTASEKYEVYINDALKVTRMPNNKTYLLEEDPGLYEIGVKPLIDSVESVSSAPTTMYVVHDLEPRLNGTVLEWDAIQGATYKLYISGKEGSIPVPTNSFNLSLANLNPGESEIRVEVLKTSSFIKYPFSKSIFVSKAHPVSTIVYNNEIVSWTASSNATGYAVTLNGNDVPGPFPNRTLDLSTYPQGLYTISVRPLLTDGIPQEAKTTRVVHKFALMFNNDVLSWDSLPNVTYSLLINGSDVALPNNTQSSIATSDLELITGTNNVKVRVTDLISTIDYPFSNEIAVVKLGAVTNLTYNGTQISWDPVNNVSQYEVFLNDVSQGMVSETSFSMSGKTVGFYHVHVLPIGSLPNSLSGIKSSIQLIHAFEIDFNSGQLSWDSIPNATYTLVYGSTQTELPLGQNTSFDLTTLTTLPAGSHAFKVNVTIAGKTNIQSPSSNTVTVTKLNSVMDITYVGGKITWSSTESSVKYQLTFNGQSYELTAREYATTLLAGDNSVSIITTKDGLYLPSEPSTQTLTAQRLSKPMPTITRDPLQTNRWKVNVPLISNATRVQVTIRYFTNPTSFTSETYDSNGVDKIVISSGYTKIEVQAIAFAEVGSLYLDSEISLVVQSFN